MERAGADANTGAPVLRPNAESIRSLTGQSSVVLSGLELSNGETIDLSLTRVPVETLGFGFQVNGVPADLLTGLDLTVWKGGVLGDPASEAILSFSNSGSRGFVSWRGAVNNLMPQPGEGNDWRNSYSVLIQSRELTALGAQLDFDCGVERLANYEPYGDATPFSEPDAPAPPGGASVLYECKMAIESDFQLNQIFGGDLGAQTAYVTSLLAAASDRYVEQLDTVLTYPYVQFYTNAGDPWTSADGGGGSIDMLNEFVAAWGSSPLPGDAVLGHFLSGAGLGGGVAYLSALCDSSNDFSFGVSGNIDGDLPFPVQQGPLNWDFIVFTHEVGHNFSSPHTHDYCPPVDECPPSQYWGQCQDEEDCISTGSIMGYCHLCPGGLANVTTFFHPTVIDFMQPHIQGCLPTAAGIEATPPAIIAPDVPTTLSANVTGTPVASVELNYRFDGGPFQVVGMSHQGGGVYEGDLPAASCTDAPEFFFSTVEQTLGAVQTATFTAVVGLQSFSFQDDFQTDTGWTVGVGDDDATTGIWERADPNGTEAQPDSGFDAGTGSLCFFTGNASPGSSVGTNDVDGGKTTLVSPSFDLSGTDSNISYQRWYSNNAGSTPNTDVFVVEVSNNGSTWVNVETVGPAGSETAGGWIYHEFKVSDFVTPTSNVQVRFVASDEGEGSIVEAAIDEFDVFSLDCEICQPDLGFGGPGSVTLAICGQELAAGNSATVEVNGPVSSVAVIVWSTSNNPVAIGTGTLVPNPIDGFLVDLTDGSGNISLPVNGGNGPLSLFVQALVFDAGLAEVQFSNAVEAVFLP